MSNIKFFVDNTHILIFKPIGTKENPPINYMVELYTDTKQELVTKLGNSAASVFIMQHKNNCRYIDIINQYLLTH